MVCTFSACETPEKHQEVLPPKEYWIAGVQLSNCSLSPMLPSFCSFKWITVLGRTFLCLSSGCVRLGWLLSHEIPLLITQSSVVIGVSPSVVGSCVGTRDSWSLMAFSEAGSSFASLCSACLRFLARAELCSPFDGLLTAKVPISAFPYCTRLVTNHYHCQFYTPKQACPRWEIRGRSCGS
jgi:hypothetical protein